MHIDDLDAFTDTLTATMDVYSKPVNPMTIQVWWGALEKYDLNAVMNGFSRHIQNPDNGQFAPKPADIVRHVEGTTQDRALNAWSKVDKAIRQVGTYQSVSFDDPIIHLAINDMGGWIKLGGGSDDEWPFLAREFENRYRGYLGRDIKDYPAKLTGIAEASNSEAGQKIAPPVLIGNQEKAEQVYLGGGENKAIEAKPLQGLNLKRIA